MGKVEGTLVFDKDNYKTKEELFIAIGNAVKMLIELEYECLVRYEDVGIYILEYCYNRLTLGGSCDRFIVATAEEEEQLDEADND